MVGFESDGGNVVAAIKIGEYIRRKKFNTVVIGAAQCASACALAWLGGTRRFMSGDARIGFHAAFTTDREEAKESGVGNALIGAYLTRLGLPYSAVIYITRAAPDSMTWLDSSGAQQHGIEVSLFAPDSSSSDVLPATKRREKGYATGYAGINSWKLCRDQQYDRTPAVINEDRKEVDKVLKAIDPDGKLPESDRNMKGLAYIYSYYLPRDKDKAANVAAKFLDVYRGASMRYGALAAAAAARGDNDTAVKAAMRAYANIPDGREFKVLRGANGQFGYEFTDKETGKLIQRGVLDPKQVAAQAMSMASGEAFDRYLVEAAGGYFCP